MKMKNKKQNEQKGERLTRKEALKKGGKYAAFTAATMMMILGPSNNAAASSQAPSAPDRWPR